TGWSDSGLRFSVPAHGSWSAWGSWGSCSGSCREEGSSHAPRRRRNRTCTNPTPSFDPPGDPCPGADVDVGLCDFLPFCPIAGNWGSWAEISQCSVSCGIGMIRQSRACDSPPPKHGSPDCSGIRSRDVPCNTGLPCPVDGVWTNWGHWSFCARTGWNISCKRFVGQQRRTRLCRGRNHGGEPCQGSIIEIRTCYDSDNCWYGKGVWSDWSDWGLCLPPCGEGSTRSRSRVCEPVYPDYSMTGGILKQVNISFSGYPRFECDELEGEHETLQEYWPCQHVPLCD
ncbi:properdin-like, partial [Chiloscyllium plagiosum]|uniref:properdin-like n=1 Tax=Chiloscyllium plagiosum TaxID=36176 RepID=UPI001CB86147